MHGLATLETMAMALLVVVTAAADDGPARRQADLLRTGPELHRRRIKYHNFNGNIQTHPRIEPEKTESPKPRPRLFPWEKKAIRRKLAWTLGIGAPVVAGGTVGAMATGCGDPAYDRKHPHLCQPEIKKSQEHEQEATKQDEGEVDHSAPS